MRIIMMGTGPFAVPTFRALHATATIPLLVTRPPVIRKGKAPPNPMREQAEALGIPVFDPPDINEESAVARLRQEKADLLVVCDYGQILSNEALSTTPLGGINLHGSLLPRFRGAAPVNWAVLSGDATTGVTVIHMTPRLDAGPELARYETPIGATETAEELEPRLAAAGVQPVLDAIQQLSQWDRESPLGNIQDSTLVTKAPRLKKSDGAVDWSRPAIEIERQVRGLKPWPGTFTFYAGKKGEVRLILDQVEVASCLETADSPGQVLLAEGEQLLVQTGDGVLGIRAVQPAGKRVMPVSEFLRGNALRAGTVLLSRDR